MVGGATAYVVGLEPAGGTLTWVFDSPARRASPTIAGQNVSIDPVSGTFYVNVTRGDRTVGSAPLPPKNESVTLGTLTLRHRNDTIVAVHDDTRVDVAHAETYN